MRGSAKRSLRVLAVVCAVATLIPATPGIAYHTQRKAELERLIDQRQSDIARLSQREGRVLRLLNESAQRQAVLEQRLRDADARLADARAILADIELRLDQVSSELMAKTAELEATLGALDEKVTILNDRVRQIYMGAPSTYSSAFERARSFTDVVYATQYIEGVVQSDRAVVDDIEATKRAVEGQRAEIEARKAVVEGARLEQRSVTDRIAADRADRADAEAEVADEVALQRSLLARIRHRKSSYLKVLHALERESQSIEQFLNGAQVGQNVIQGQGGWLKWPVSASITSPYGWRTHPVYGYRSFHTGIDLGVGYGTTVKAARAGEVLYTGYQNAYGLVVLIDHGNSVATLYAHLSRTFVRAGEVVGSLESIAASGSSGWSTGPHLHFEVRVHGEPSNPMGWLTKR